MNHKMHFQVQSEYSANPSRPVSFTPECDSAETFHITFCLFIRKMGQQSRPAKSVRVKEGRGSKERNPFNI